MYSRRLRRSPILAPRTHGWTEILLFAQMLYLLKRYLDRRNMCANSIWKFTVRIPTFKWTNVFCALYLLLSCIFLCWFQIWSSFFVAQNSLNYYGMSHYEYLLLLLIMSIELLRKIRNEEITCPNTFILYLTAYLIHYFYSSKTRGDRKKHIDFRFGINIE